MSRVIVGVDPHKKSVTIEAARAGTCTPTGPSAKPDTRVAIAGTGPGWGMADDLLQGRYACLPASP